MKKHILLVTLLTATITLFSPLSSMEPDITNAVSLYQKVEKQYLVCKEELNIAIQNNEDIPLQSWSNYIHAVNRFSTHIEITILLSPDEKAHNNYLLRKEILKIAIQKKHKNIPANWSNYIWSNYVNAAEATLLQLENVNSQSENAIPLSPYDKAQKKYLLRREVLNIAIQKKEKDILPHWSNYIETLKNFHAAIPDTNVRKKNNIFIKCTTAITNKQLKENQLACKNEVKKHKEIIANKISAKEKVTLKELIIYQLTLHKYILKLPTEEMKKAPQETFDMLDAKINSLAKNLCDDIESNRDNYDQQILINNYNEVNALEHYSRALILKNNYILTQHLKRLLLTLLKQKYPKAKITSSGK